MTTSKKLRAAILGFGGMGHCHAAQYPSLRHAELVALCDSNPKQLKKTDLAINLGDTGSTDLGGLGKYVSYEDLIQGEPELDFIDICLPSDLHCEYACRAMRDGFHVLCEKPMALNSRDCRKMMRVSEETGRKLMIAQVVRFDEQFGEIRKACQTGRYGRLLRLVLHRNAGLPGGWFRDVNRSGGALMDLHLHDIDFIQSLLGVPDVISCFGSLGKSGGIDDALCNYVYPSGVTACSESSWTRKEFYAEAAAIFENATLEIGRDGLTLYQVDRPVRKIQTEGKNPYGLEIDYFARCIQQNKSPERCMPESTCRTVQIIEKERLSIAGSGKRIALKK